MKRARLLITLAAPLAGILAAEGAVRVLDLRQPPWPERGGGLFRDSEDPVLIFENNPGAMKTLTYREHADGPARVLEMRVNEQGFRGPVVARERTPGTLRVACLGDSHTFGEGVVADQTWPAHLARELADTGLTPPEVMNCGVNAYDTLQEVLWMEREVLGYEPDVVLLQYYVNDTAARGLPMPAPDDAVLSLASPHRKDWVADLRGVSRFADLVLDGLYRRRGLAVYSDLRTQLYEPENPGWLRVQDALRRARDGLAERDIAFGLVLYPFLVQRGPTLTSHDAFRIVMEFCESEAIPYLDTEAAFLAHDVDALRVSVHDYHGNGVAHEIFAREVAAWMSAQSWTQPGR